jgi:peptidoglycan/xylan/chitin deacetylase (PgdA/CDA1 family)
MKFIDLFIEEIRGFVWNLRYRDFLVVFNWHQITPVFDPQRHHTYTWTKLSDFETEVSYLAKGFHILPLNEAIGRLKRGSLRGACAALSFDDGDISIAEHVTPCLRRLKLPATFFINTAYLDCSRSYWFPILAYVRASEETGCRVALPAELREKSQELRRTSDPSFYNEMRIRVEQLAPLVPNMGSRLVSTEWLSRLDGDQFAIGAHGHEHQRFSMMAAEWQRKDLVENTRRLSYLRAYRPIFAVPFGRPWDWSDETIRIAHEQSLDVVLAHGGINLGPAASYHRNPCDSRKLRPLIRAAMIG